MTKQVHAPVEFNLAEELWKKMEEGLTPWQMTWGVNEAPGRPQNVVSQKAYRGGNSFMLMMIGVQHGWSNNWLTFNQAREAGGGLKGEKGSRIETPIIRKKVNDAGEEKEFLMGFRSAVVFNASQVTGVELYGKKAVEVHDGCEVVAKMRDGLIAQGLNVKEGPAEEGCWYRPGDDTAGIPPQVAFDGQYEYYSALAHVLARSTMTAGRVERENRGLAYEMVRSEMAATLICSTLGLPRTQAQIDNNASFMSQWLSDFADQKQMLLKAASEATAIHDYLMDLAAMNADRKIA